GIAATIKPAADGIGGSEKALGEGRIDDGNWGRLRMVASRELAAGGKPRSCRCKVAGRGIETKRRGGVLWAEVRRIFPIHRVRRLINTQGDGVGQRRRLYAWQTRNLFQCPLLKNAAACLIIAGNSKVKADDGSAIRLQPERHFQRPH